MDRFGEHEYGAAGVTDAAGFQSAEYDIGSLPQAPSHFTAVHQAPSFDLHFAQGFFDKGFSIYSFMAHTTESFGLAWDCSAAPSLLWQTVARKLYLYITLD